MITGFKIVAGIIVLFNGQTVYDGLCNLVPTTPTCVKIKTTGTSPVDIRAYHPSGHVYPNHQFAYNLADQGHLTTGDIADNVVQKYKIVARFPNNKTITASPTNCATTCIANDSRFYCNDHSTAKKILVKRLNSNKLKKHRSKPKF